MQSDTAGRGEMTGRDVAACVLRLPSAAGLAVSGIELDDKLKHIVWISSLKVNLFLLMVGIFRVVHRGFQQGRIAL